MTTIVGICCKDGLVVASDSKATRGPSAREEFLKIWDLETGRFPTVITGAGRTAFIAKYRDLLRVECAGRAQRQPIQSVPEFVQLAEETMQNMSRQYGTERLARLGLLRIGTSDEDQKTSILDMFPQMVAVIGVYADETAHLYFITPDGVAEEQQLYGASGSGGPYAEYLLPRTIQEGMGVAEAAICATHVIEQVKHVDTHSGGPTQLAVLTKSGVRHWRPVELAAMTDAICKIELRTSAVWRRAIKSEAARNRHGKNRKR